jgi:hypothetical protein
MRNKNVTKRASPEERVKQEEIKQKKEEETDAKRIEREEYEQIAEKRKLYDELGLTKMTEDINKMDNLISKTRIGTDYDPKIQALRRLKERVDVLYKNSDEIGRLDGLNKKSDDREILELIQDIPRLKRKFNNNIKTLKEDILSLNAQLLKKGGKKTRKNLSFQKQNIRL